MQRCVLSHFWQLVLHSNSNLACDKEALRRNSKRDLGVLRRDHCFRQSELTYAFESTPCFSLWSLHCQWGLVVCSFHRHAPLLHGLERLQLDDEPLMPRELLSATDQYLLFFDGGSRGNPGPGGSGAVVIHTDAFGGRPTIEWAAAMSLSDPKTTNNQAEYLSLVTGLRFAHRRRLQPLTVISDSAMIIAQLRDHRAPKDSRLRRQYGEARILADVLRITKWCHHVRAYNKMADCAANLAMDTLSSIQTLNPMARSCWTELRTYLGEDG